MQPFQCDLQAQIPKHPITTHTQAHPKQLEATVTMRQKKRQTDRSRNRRTDEVPFIAGCSHFTRKNTRFRAPASSPKQSPCNIMQPFQCDLQAQIPKHPITTHTQAHPTQLEATVTMRQKKKANRPQPQPPHRRGTFHRRLQPLYTEKHKVSCSGFLPKTGTPEPMQHHAAITMRSEGTDSSPLPFFTTSLRHHFPSSPLPFVTTSLLHHFPSSALPFIITSLFHHFPSSPLPFSTTSLPHHFPSSPLPFFTSLPFFTTSLRHHFPSSPLPFVTTSLLHHFPSSPLPFFTTSLLHHFPSSPLPFLTTSLRHHFPSSPLPFLTTSLPHHSPSSSLPFFTTSLPHHFPSSQSLPPSSPLPFVTTLCHSFLFFCCVLLDNVLFCDLPPFIIVNCIK